METHAVKGMQFKNKFEDRFNDNTSVDRFNAMLAEEVKAGERVQTITMHRGLRPNTATFVAVIEEKEP